MTINDNITIGSYQFTVNPQQYSVSYILLKTNKRSLNGKLQTSYVVDDNNKVIKKREITISGISDNQLSDILLEFEKAEDLTFIDIYNDTFNVQFDDFNYDIDSESVNYPKYKITLIEV